MYELHLMNIDGVRAEVAYRQGQVASDVRYARARLPRRNRRHRPTGEPIAHS
jgi:hypothetical protein